MRQQSFLIYIALAITAFLFFMERQLIQLPDTKPISAPTNEFSGERAFSVLSHLLQENKPHPVGSKLNKIVKQRIIDRLTKLNIEVSVQRTWSCSHRVNSCAMIENIIGIIPGLSDTGYVTLMAHYDSVPMAPGAGDDGAAVAAILETARILKSEAPFQKPILLLITDAEELGLLGAEAFWREHELADKVGIVLDFEGSGTTGVSQVLRTSGANKLFMEAFKDSSNPRGASLINEIFKRMPNDTDFSVVMRANVPGIDFAFASERNHYHTPNDNLENIDHRTIQHHGENMLPLTRWLANNDFSTEQSNLVYSANYGYWLQWPTSISPYLIITSLLLLGFAFYRTSTSVLGVLAGAGSALLVIISTIVSALIVFKILSTLQTTVGWPAIDLPYRFILAASTLLGGLLAGLLINRYVKFYSALLGGWLLWIALSIPLMIYMPDAVNVLLVPLLAGVVILVIATFIPEKFKRAFLLISLLFVLPSTLGVAGSLETSQGYHLIVATFPFIALFMSVFIPLIHGSSLRIPLLASTSTVIIAMLIAVNTPLYSAKRPQLVNINYIENLETQSAVYQLQSQNPLPQNMTSLLDFETAKKALLPYSNFEFNNWLNAEVSNLQPPILTVKEIEITDDGQRSVELMVSSPRHADVIQLTIPGSAQLKGVEIDGIKFEAKLLERGFYKNQNPLILNGVYDREVSLKLFFETSEPVTIIFADISTQLPASAKPILEQRSGELSPVHQGDRAMLYRSVTF